MFRKIIFAAGLLALTAVPALALDIIVVNTTKVDLHWTIYVDLGGNTKIMPFDMDKPLKAGQRYTLKNALPTPPAGGKTQTIKIALLDKDEEECAIPGVSFSNVAGPSVEFRVTQAHIAKCRGFADGKADM